MKRKNVVIIFIAFVAGLMALELRLFVLMTDGELAKTARSQSALSVELALHRPDFFDCNGERLTGSDDAAAALAFPRTESGYSLLQYVAADDRVDFLEQMEGNLPFAVRVNPNAASAAPDRVIAIKSRYSADAPCAHIIGTLGPDGHGDSGLEHALDDYLSKASASLCMTVEVNANRQPKSGETPALIQRGATGEGIILTIDKKIQQIVETQAETLIKRGAVVVVDCATSEIRAIASIPDFDPDNVAAYLSQEDSPLFNRALAAYNVGSIYKPVIAAAALSCGIDESFSYECVGRIEVDGQVYTCNDGAAHGTVDMHGAIVKSCNTYFIALGQRAGAAAIFNTASAMGLGKPVSLFGSLASASGSLPTQSALSVTSELCNHSFGQGTLLATPLQVAEYTCCLANGGNLRPLSLVLSVGGEHQSENSANRVICEQAAVSIANCLKKAVQTGTGRNAQPSFCEAAGKTGTAQTGRVKPDGSEYVIGWFTGWFPADNPQYVITVMTEDAGYGFASAAPVFAAIANAMFESGCA